jgi:hypothetical protein
MWVCKNLSTGEYLTGRLTFDDHEHYMIVETTDVRDRAYGYYARADAEVLAEVGLDEFGLEGFEPVEE